MVLQTLFLQCSSDPSVSTASDLCGPEKDILPEWALGKVGQLLGPHLVNWLDLIFLLLLVLTCSPACLVSCVYFCKLLKTLSGSRQIEVNFKANKYNSLSPSRLSHTVLPANPLACIYLDAFWLAPSLNSIPCHSQYYLGIRESEGWG